MNTKLLYLMLIIFLANVLSGCIGAKTFNYYARAGDTVALAAGWRHNYGRDNITVTITPSSGAPIVYMPNDPAVRAVVNMYPDPLSGLIVSPLVGMDMTPGAQTYADLVGGIYTNYDQDWWQTAVFVDLPGSLPQGTARIDITNPQGESTFSNVNIVPGTGQPIHFSYRVGNSSDILNDNQLHSMERIGNYVIQFSGSTIPYALQLDLTHVPDVNNGGAGIAHVVNTRGDLKNAAWSDDGTNLRIILNPAKGQALAQFSDFKVYVTGGISGLQLLNLKAVDINGNPVTGVTANITWNN
jgi:hypothetical protein